MKILIGIILTLFATYLVYTGSGAKKRGIAWSRIFLALSVIILPIVLVPIVFLPVIVLPAGALLLYFTFKLKTISPPVPPQRVNFSDNIIDVEAKPVSKVVKCSRCAKQVGDDFKICPHCGYTLRPVCQKCGQGLETHWKACPVCQMPAVEK